MDLANYQLNYQIETLPNGLEVIICPDHSSPVAAIQIW